MNKCVSFQSLRVSVYGLFFIECADGHYNALCSGTCGHCLNEQVCDKYDGSCLSGCKPNFDSPLCQGIFLHFQRNIDKKLHIK